MKGHKNMSELVRFNKLVPSLIGKDEFLTPFSSWYDDFFNELGIGTDIGFFAKGTYPKVDIIDEEKQVVIEAEVPGLTKDQVSVELSNGVLQIKGEKKEELGNKCKKYVHRELKHSTFCRSFSVGDNVDKDTVEAKFENGVLTVTLQKVVPLPKSEPKKIEIK